MTGEADEGRGFLRTGDGSLTRDVWAWNAENDGTLIEGVANNLERADEDAWPAGRVETAWGLGWRPSSMVSAQFHDSCFTRSIWDLHTMPSKMPNGLYLGTLAMPSIREIGIGRYYEKEALRQLWAWGAHQ